jgi:hypothetical protein
MTSLSRQNTLFVSEDWVAAYEALQNVDFRAYDAVNLSQAMINYVSKIYPEEFNDWVTSSEFIMKIDILGWLAQNISFRTDLNTRENFLATAERRDSLLKLAQNIAYKVSRVRSASGQVKITKIRTNQPVVDSNGTLLRNKDIIFNDPSNEDWFEQFVLILNSAFAIRTQFGKPINHFRTGNLQIDQYVLNSIAPLSGAYSFNTTVNNINLSFDIYNSTLDPTTGVYKEQSPNGSNAFNLYYVQDGRGLSSSVTGFFLPIKQGNLVYQDQNFSEPRVIRTFTIESPSINNDDFFVQAVDSNGNFIENWTQIDSLFGESVSFNSKIESNKIYELDTLVNDRVRVRFGDGSFGKIPVGNFRFWYRTAYPTAPVIRSSDIVNKTVSIPYVSNGALYTLTFTFSLTNSLVNAGTSESDFDIRTRANKVFSTQNRMITGSDYNRFFLKDNSIRKVKTVNRTYAGHSAYSKLNDPTGLYSNVFVLGSDGRYYQENTTNVQLAPTSELAISVGDFLATYVRPLIKKDDKFILYYNNYFESAFTNTYFWKQTSVINGRSRGNIVDAVGNIVPVGVSVTTVSNRRFILNNSVIRYGTLTGSSFTVRNIVGDGTAPGAVQIDSFLPTQQKLISVLPPLRNVFNTFEENTFRSLLTQNLNFAVSWNQFLQEYIFITFNNIDSTSQFSLQYQGDTSNTNKDSSWIMLFEYIQDVNGSRWKITDRGTGTFFESARQIDFFFANNLPVIDPSSGLLVSDYISISGANESRDSLRRRGLQSSFTGQTFGATYQFVGDGTTTCFKTTEQPLSSQTTTVSVNSVFQSYGPDYTITPGLGGDSICFITAPSANANIVLTISQNTRPANQSVGHSIGNGTFETILVNERYLTPSNTLVFKDGVFQEPNKDYGIIKIGTQSFINFGSNIENGVEVYYYSFGNIDTNVFVKYLFNGDGSTKAFTLTTKNQSSDTVLVTIDGITQMPSEYVVTGNAVNSTITFNAAPATGTIIRVISVFDVNSTRTKMYSFTGDGTLNNFTLGGITNIAEKNIIVFMDGVAQYGPTSSAPVWSISGTNKVLFSPAPLNGIPIQIWAVLGSTGRLINPDPDDTSVIPDTTPTNLGTASTSSLDVFYMGADQKLSIVDVLRHPDGYVNPNGLFVKPFGSQSTDDFTNPFLFKNIVLANGFTDLVLWRRITEFGFSIWDPISSTTLPSGTYGQSSKGDVKAGDAFTLPVIAGSIHYDITTNKWLVANADTLTWLADADQTKYRFRLGRDNLKFSWVHVAADTNRIDPSVSNIMNTYILTSTYDTAYRAWLRTNGDESTKPAQPTSESLRIQYSSFENFKAESDAIIYYPASFVPLFGRQAIPELQATFKVVKNSSSQLTDSDLKLRILNAIGTFFSVDNWNFGETFYFTELAAYIHKITSPDVQSIVIVPKAQDQAFGRMFQARCQSDELFVSAASVNDIVLIDALTDDELRIGSLGS